MKPHEISMPDHANPVVHVGEQYSVDVLAGADGAVVDGLLSAEAAEFIQVRVHRGKVAFPQRARIAEHVAEFLHPLKLRRAGEVEVEFLIVEHMKDEHVVASMAEQFQSLEQPRSRHEQIRDQHDHAPAALSFSDVAQHIEDVSLLLRFLGFESQQDVVEMRPFGVRRDLRANRFIKCHKSHRVLLPQQQMRQRRRRRASVVVLRCQPMRRATRSAAEPHRLAKVHDQRRPQVRVFFVELYINLVGLRPHLPVDAPHVVTGDVLTMLHELDRLPEVRTAMTAGQKTFDDLPRLDFQPSHSRDDFGTQMLV